MQIKTSLFVILLLLFVGKTQGQENKKLADVKSYCLQPPKGVSGSSVKIPFNQIIIKDFRYDTTKFGYIQKGGIHKIVFSKDSTGGLNELLNNYYHQNLTLEADKKLLVILKKLWLQRDPNSIAAGRNEKKDFDWGDKSNAAACMAEIEVFAVQGDKHYPLVKIKDNFMSYPYATEHLTEFLLLPFDALIKKISETEVNTAIFNRKAYSLGEIMHGYSLRFDIPVLSSKPAMKGVFLSYDSFKLTQTIYPDFRVNKTRNLDQVFVRENGKEIELTNCWGYFDGEEYYIKAADNFFLLYRQNNTWDFYGNNHLNISYYSYFNGGAPFTMRTTGRQTVLAKQPLQLNMDTGDIY